MDNLLKWHTRDALSVKNREGTAMHPVSNMLRATDRRGKR